MKKSILILSLTSILISGCIPVSQDGLNDANNQVIKQQQEKTHPTKTTQKPTATLRPLNIPQPETQKNHKFSVTEAVVTKVLDGDTIVVNLLDNKAGFDLKNNDLTNVKVRLLDINAPEIAHNGKKAECGGEQAKEELTQLLEPGEKTVIRLITDEKALMQDKYGRVLAYIQRKNETNSDINKIMVEKGFAKVWYPAKETEPTRTTNYISAQKRAMREKLGNWNKCTNFLNDGYKTPGKILKALA